jgi:hypothetical protein
MKAWLSDCIRAFLVFLLIGCGICLAAFLIGMLANNAASGLEAAKDTADFLTALSLFFLAGSLLVRTKQNEQKEKDRDRRINKGLRRHYDVIGIRTFTACGAASFLLLAVVLDALQRMN